MNNLALRVGFIQLPMLTSGHRKERDEQLLSSIVADNVIHRLRGCAMLKEDADRVAEVLMQCVKPDNKELS